MKSSFGSLLLAVLSALFTLVVAAGHRSPNLDRDTIEKWNDKIRTDPRIETAYKLQPFYITMCPPLKDAHIQLSYATGRNYPVHRRSSVFDWLASYIDNAKSINHVSLAYTIQGGKCGMIYVDTTVKVGNLLRKDRFRWKEPRFVPKGSVDAVHIYQALGTVKLEELRLDVEEALERAVWAYGGLMKGGFKEVSIERVVMQDTSEQPVYRFKQLKSDKKLEVRVRTVDGEAFLVENKRNPSKPLNSVV